MRAGPETPALSVNSAPHRQRGLRYALAVISSILVLAPLLDTVRVKEESHVSGAYEALSFWGASRAYPGRDIPGDAISSAHAYAKTELRRPLAQAFGLRAKPSTSAANPHWDAIGPTNGAGRTLALAFDPLNANILYAGSASGGLWRSTSAGVGPTAWFRIDTGFPVLGVSTIAFEPSSSNVIYIGTGEVYNHEAAGDRAADRRTRGSYGIGILKSSDGGATWSKSLDWSYQQMRGVWMIRVDPTNHDVVWAATTEGVYRSPDAGNTWEQKLDVIMATDLVVHPSNPDIVVVGCGNLSSIGRGVYRTTDGGDTWAQIAGGGLPSDFNGKVKFGVTPAAEDVIYASIGNGFFFPIEQFTWLLRSDDFGASWALQSTTDYSRHQGWYSHDVAVHPHDAATIVCVGIAVWTSADAGTTLVVESGGSPFRGNLPPGDPEGTADWSHPDHHDVIFHPTNPDTIYVSNDGGVYRSLDGGATFEAVNGGMQTQQFYNGTASDPLSPDRALGGLQDNGTVMYLGNGEWFRWLAGADGGWAGLDPTNPDILYVTWQWMNLGKSVNGGDSFTEISPPGLGGPVAFISPFLLSPTDPLVIYAGTSYLFKSLNGGSDWIVGAGGAPLDGNPILNLAIAQDSDTVLYAATYPDSGRGRVHVTRDGGATFSDITGMLPDRYPGDLIVDPTDEATAYIAISGFGSSHVFKTIDYGASWSDIDNGRLPDVPANAVVVDPLFPNHVYVGNDIGVFVTIDGGATWVQLALGLPEAMLVSDLNISLANRKLRAFTHGNGVYEHELLDALVAVEEPLTAPRTLALLQNAPNPFHLATDIRFELAHATEVELAVYDLRGARVLTLASDTRSAGSHTVRWDRRDRNGRQVPPGTYFYRLRSGGQTATKRMIVLE